MANTEYFELHPVTPEVYKIKQVIEKIKEGAVILYPTDTGFTLGCELGNRDAINRLRRLRRMPDSQSLTFLCDDVANISEFGKVSNKAFKYIKKLIPGPYTFILPASKLVPRLAQNPKRKTAGIRVPNNNLAQQLLKLMEMPLISISAKNPDYGDDYAMQPDEIVDYFSNQVDVIVTSEDYNFTGESTVIDLTSDDFQIIREGAGLDEALSWM
jgi:tRNA threonylcarbamoyl adenosine modification protein (Sua5/YciO/YrdC/YwlC family)